MTQKSKKPCKVQLRYQAGKQEELLLSRPHLDEFARKGRGVCGNKKVHKVVDRSERARYTLALLIRTLDCSGKQVKHVNRGDYVDLGKSTFVLVPPSETLGYTLA